MERYSEYKDSGVQWLGEIPGPFLSGINVPLPPLTEQHAIVSYLDDKCGKIDKMLEVFYQCREVVMALENALKSTPD